MKHGMKKMPKKKMKKGMKKKANEKNVWQVNLS